MPQTKNVGTSRRSLNAKFFGRESDKAAASTSQKSPPDDEEGPDKAEEILRLQEELMIANGTIESDQDVVHQWEDRVAELEASIQSLTDQIEEEQEEANKVIS
jgi:chromosome segregation ATPase